MKPTTVQFPDTNALAILYGWVPEGGLDSAIEYPSLDMANDSGADLLEGQAVVVLADGTIGLTTTAGDTRPKGILLDDIADGDSGPVQFFGPVDLVRVTAAVTAGNWGQTSTTPGAAEEASDGFVYFTSSGTEPEGFLWPWGNGTGGGGGGLTEDDADELYLKRKAGEDHLVYTSAGTGSSEALDLTAYNTFDLTLDDDCALSFAGPLPSGVHLQWTIVLRQDGGGPWTVTWPAAVQWQDTDGSSGGSAPSLFTAADAVNVFVITTLDGGTTYGAASDTGGTSGTTSPLTTKGDLWGYDTADARVPVGANTYLLVADSSDAQGVVWKDPQTTGHWEPLMDGGSPYAPLDDGTGTDWLWVWVA